MHSHRCFSHLCDLCEAAVALWCVISRISDGRVAKGLKFANNWFGGTPTAVQFIWILSKHSVPGGSVAAATEWNSKGSPCPARAEGMQVCQVYKGRKIISVTAWRDIGLEKYVLWDHVLISENQFGSDLSELKIAIKSFKHYHFITWNGLGCLLDFARIKKSGKMEWFEVKILLWKMKVLFFKLVYQLSLRIGRYINKWTVHVSCVFINHRAAVWWTQGQAERIENSGAEQRCLCDHYSRMGYRSGATAALRLLLLNRSMGTFLSSSLQLSLPWPII